jgi:protoporphyrinogen oxidase
VKNTWDVIIVGAGLSGLTAALVLNQAGLSCLIVEATQDVGGRIKTDRVEGFLLDRGFQVLLTAYPEVQQFLDLKALNLKYFYNGASIWAEKQFKTIADPWRHPIDGFKTAFSSVGTLSDKLNIAKLRIQCLQQLSAESYWTNPECSTSEFLKQKGFSAQIIQQFFKPFFTGIFLEPDLQTSSRLFEFLYGCFAQGRIGLPAEGMQAIPRQLQGRLTATEIQFDTRVSAVEPKRVEINGQTWLDAKHAVIVATDVLSAGKLFSRKNKTIVNGVSCYYFSAPEAPPIANRLVLNTEPGRRINTLCVPSMVSKSYASNGKALVSVTSLSGEALSPELLHGLQAELREWFGRSVNDWQFLKHYTIANALPAKTVPSASIYQHAAKLSNGVFVAGDYLNTPSINGAMRSGRLAAEAILQQ